MPTFDESFPAIESALFQRYGGSPAPADDDLFPTMVAITIGRSADAKQVAKAISALDEAGLLDPQTLADVDSLEIAETLKARRISFPPRRTAVLQRLARWYVETLGPQVKSASEVDLSTEALRESLTSINGIGLATADALLLEAFQRAVYPVDRASYRILVRHGWIDTSADYPEAQSVLEQPALDDASRLHRLSQGMQRLGKDFCKSRVAHCERCPLKPMLPPGGAIEPEGFEEDVD